MPDPTTDIAWHILNPGMKEADEVPDMIEHTTDLVRGMLDQSKSWAQDSLADARKAMTGLQTATGPDHLPEPPDAPELDTRVSTSVGLSFDNQPNLGVINATSVAEFSPEAITVPDLTTELGPYVPVITGLSIPDAPQLVLPVAPVAPGLITEFALPSAPVPDYGSAPAIADLNLPTYVSPALPVFNDAAPEFNVLPPDPFIQWTEPQYSSDIKDAVKLVLQQMLAGGTGLPADVEQAIWERARGREGAEALKVIAEAMGQWASRGYAFPPGELNKQIQAVRDETERKVNEHSREVMIKQAELEQTNRNFAVTQGIGYEQVFVGLFMQIVDRNFQIAKFAVETQIQIFNLKISAFNVQQAVFAQKTERFKALLEAAFTQIKAFQAQVDAQKAKGELEQVKVAAFNARVQAFNGQVESFKALVSSVVARSELERNKVELFKGQVEANVGLINGQRAAFEGYSARVQAESAKAGLEEANARAYSAKVQGIAAKAEVSLKTADVKIQANRMRLEYAIGNLNRSTQLVQQQLGAIQANAAVYEANIHKGVARFEADKQLRVVQLQTNIELSKLAVAKYGAMLESWRTRAQQILSTFQINAESLRAAGQIAATLAAGAMAGTHVSAGVSGSAGASQSKSTASTKGQSFQQSVSDQSSYGVSHIYNHEV
jgi:hypothetical protein